MNIDLDKCILLTSEEYCSLESPIFEGQTRVDSNNQYYMVFSQDGILYKTLNTL